MEVETREIPRPREYWGYFGYGLGQCLSFGIVGSILLFFYTDVLGIAPGAAALIFLIARGWDALNDPMLASWIDSHHTKGKDKFKPYLLKMPLFLVLGTVLLFVTMPNAGATVKFLYALTTYVLWGMIYTVSDISFWSTSTVASAQSQERVKFITAANIGVFGGIGLAGFLLPVLVNLLNSGSFLNINYQYIAAVAFMMVAMLLPITVLGAKQIKERVHHKGNETITLRDILRYVRSNKYLAIILLVYFLNFFMNLVQAIAIFFFDKHYPDGGLTFFGVNFSLFAFYSFLSMLVALTFLLIPVLSHKFSKKPILYTLFAIDCGLRLVFLLYGYGNPYFSLLMMTLLLMVYSMTAPILSVMIADTVEYAEYQTGVRAEAVTFSGQTFAGKLSVALSGSCAGLILAFIGYDPQLSVQSQRTLDGLFYIVALLPLIGVALRFLLLFFFYDYNEEKHQEITEKLKEGFYAFSKKDGNGKGA